MSKRQAPYAHSDGSGCWTKNCSLGHRSAVNLAIANNDVKAYFAAKTAQASVPSVEDLKTMFTNNQNAVNPSKGLKKVEATHTPVGQDWRSQIQPRLSEEHLLSHRAPDGSDDESYKAAHDLTNIFPSDVLDHPDWYCGEVDPEAVKALKRIQGNPDALVTIYRSAPKEITHIQDGDWVSLSKKYAQDHGRQDKAEDDWPVIEATVPARVLWSDGNDLNEFGISLIREK